jgi:pimeloyl-ACP methyl ester carboxylesterase
VPDTRILSISGQIIEYRIVEPAQPRAFDVVMLHEGLGSVSMWRDFPERLANASRCRTLVYSRLGYGRSSALGTARTPDYMHDEARVWLPRILERTQMRAPVLFGHSDGGSIALIHAAEPGARISGVIALAPHVKVEDITVMNIARARVAYERSDLRTRLARHHADVDSAFWGWNRIWLDPAFGHWNIEGLLPQIRVPVLAIQGNDDEYGTMEQVEGIARVLDGASVLKLEACRHSPHRDQPDAVLAAATEFLERIEQRAAS